MTDQPRRLHPVEPPYDPTYDDTPNHDPNAERALLHVLLTTPTIGPRIRHDINPSDLYRPDHETIWATWHELNEQHDTPPDPITLAAHLARTRTTTAAARTVRDIAFDTTLTLTASAAQVDTYTRIIRDHARLRTAQNAATRLNQLLRTATPDTLDTAFGDALDTIENAALRFGPTTHNPTTWTPLPLDPVLAGDEVDPPPNLLTREDGQHLLYTGAIHTLSGEPGSGKTWVALVAAAQVLNTPTPTDTPPHIVTMVDFEDRASRVVGRLLALGVHPNNIRHRFRYIRPNTGIDTTTTRDLDHATHDATLVILDGVTEAMTLHGLDLNANSDVATFYDLLPRRIANHGAAVVMIDHVVKDGEKQGRWALGGQHKLAGIDGVAYLVKAVEPFGRGKTGRARITVSKDRPGYIEEIALGRTVAELRLDATDVNFLRYALEAPAAATTDEAGNMRPTHLMEKVSRWLEGNPRASRTQIETGVSGKVTYLRRAIDRLVQEGYVEVHPGPRNTQQHRVVTPYREDDDTHPNTLQETLP